MIALLTKMAAETVPCIEPWKPPDRDAPLNGHDAKKKGMSLPRSLSCPLVSSSCKQREGPWRRWSGSHTLQECLLPQGEARRLDAADLVICDRIAVRRVKARKVVQYRMVSPACPTC